MVDHVHFIPVGFDFDRLVQPISQGDLPADRVVLLHSGEDNDDKRAEEFAAQMVAKLETTFENVLGIDTKHKSLDDIYDYADAYVYAHSVLLEEIQKGNEAHVNISSMPRTVAFAFATAAGTIAAEKPSLRESIHTYYVAPEQYLVLKMLDQLEAEQTFLDERLKEQYDIEMNKRFEKISSLLEEISSHGITRGVKTTNGDLYVEFPSVPVSGLRDFEGEIIGYLHDHDGARSIAQLAKGLADRLDVEFDDSFRSRVQYTVSTLDDEGYIERTKAGNRNETRLSTRGELWSRTHESWI